jgi:hypothetical protein
MNEPKSRSRGGWSLVWPLVSFVAVVLAAAVFGLASYQLINGGPALPWLPLAVVALATVPAVWWAGGVRAKRRWHAALDYYVAREMARDNRVLPPPARRPFARRRAARDSSPVEPVR